MNTCQECGMLVEVGEYHPFAACLMFKACSSSGTVKANLDAVLFKGAEKENLRVAELVKAEYDERVEQLEAENDELKKLLLEGADLAKRGSELVIGLEARNKALESTIRRIGRD